MRWARSAQPRPNRRVRRASGRRAYEAESVGCGLRADRPSHAGGRARAALAEPARPGVTVDDIARHVCDQWREHASLVALHHRIGKDGLTHRLAAKTVRARRQEIASVHPRRRGPASTPRDRFARRPWRRQAPCGGPSTRAAPARASPRVTRGRVRLAERRASRCGRRRRTAGRCRSREATHDVQSSHALSQDRRRSSISPRPSAPMAARALPLARDRS